MSIKPANLWSAPPNRSAGPAPRQTAAVSDVTASEAASVDADADADAAAQQAFANSPQMLAMKKQQWENWLTTSIPMLNDMTPMAASKTAGGRSLIEKLLDFYSMCSGGGGFGGGIDMNVDPTWARRR